MNLLPRNIELSWLMHTIKETSCQVYINVLQKRKIFESFDASSCKVEMASNNFLANGWIVPFSHVSFSDFASAFFILFHLVITTLRQRKFYNFKQLKLDSKITLYNAKHVAGVNTTSNRKLVHLNIRTEYRTVWQMEHYNVISQEQLCRFNVK